MEQILNEIRAERARQDAKFGVQNHKPFEYMAILAEEIGEANKEIVDAHFGHAPMDRCIENFRKELIQVAAVAYQASEVICRQLEKKDPFNSTAIWSDAEDEINECFSCTDARGTAFHIINMGLIGQSYGEACRKSLKAFESVNITNQELAEYISNMYMIILSVMMSITEIDNPKTGSNEH